MKKLIALVSLALGSCALDRETGTGSQTGNSIVAGRIATGDMSLPVDAKVHLRPLDWTASQPADSNRLRSTLLDSTGSFVFTEVPSGTYRLEAKKDKRGWSRTVKVLPGTNLSIPTGTLAGTGSLLCEVRLSDSTRGGRIELYGLDRWDTLPSTGSHEVESSFADLPIGLQTVRIWSKTRSKVLADIPIRIGPDSTSKVEYENGASSAKGPVEDDDEDED